MYEVEITHTLVAVKKSDVEAVVKYLALKGSDGTKGISDLGIDKLELDKTNQSGPAQLELSVKTVSYIGPELDIEELKKRISGMHLSEAKATIESIDGVNEVSIDLSFFAFGKVPSPAKTTMRLDINDYGSVGE